MSVSIYVHAIKELSDDELFLIKSYNTLIDNGLTIPEDLKQRLLEIVGEPPRAPLPHPKYGTDGFDERYELRSRTVELSVGGEGDVMYYDGKVIQLEDIPPGTKALRIFAEA